MWTTIMMMSVCVSFSSLPQSPRSLAGPAPEKTNRVASLADHRTPRFVATGSPPETADEPGSEEAPEQDQPPPPPPKKDPPEPIFPPVTPPNLGASPSAAAA